MRLADYLARVQFAGTPRPDLDTLTRLHRGHVDNIPYENLDVQLGRRVGLAAGPIFDKLVTARRGGWCYEMNGLLAWALEEIGFKVTRMAGAVMRQALPDHPPGNHFVLRIDLDRPYLADVGFGDGLVEPVPLEEGPIRQRFMDFRLERIADGWWRFHNHPRGGAPSFDFRPEATTPEVLGERCAWLQDNPASPFVLNAVVQRHFPDRIDALRGRVLRTTNADGAVNRELATREEFVAALHDVFGIALPEAATLWPKIVKRHAEVMAAAAAAQPQP